MLRRLVGSSFPSRMAFRTETSDKANSSVRSLMQKAQNLALPFTGDWLDIVATILRFMVSPSRRTNERGFATTAYKRNQAPGFICLLLDSPPVMMVRVASALSKILPSLAFRSSRVSAVNSVLCVGWPTARARLSAKMP
jgi:hypothetical protein